MPRWPRRTVIQRFVDSVDIKHGECWLWQGAPNSTGYGKFWDGVKSVTPSRWLFQQFHPATLRQDQHICHTCDTPTCVNPDHLYLGNSSANTLDAVARGRNHYANKTHCPHGHPYEGENLYRSTVGRQCRVCNRLACKKWRAKRKRRENLSRMLFGV